MNSSQKNATVSNFFAAMQETQTYVHSETLMAKEVDQYSNIVITKKVNEIFINQIINFKQYYALISMIYLLEKRQKRSLPFGDVTSFCTSKFKPENKAIESKWDFNFILDKLKLLKGNEDKYKDLIHLVTFSLIPSLSLEFLEVNSFNKFIEFIGNLPPSIQPLLSRSLFVSPFVVRFTNLIFYNDLKPFYEGIFTSCSPHFNEYSLKNIQNNFLASIRSNIHLLPSCIYVFIKSFSDESQRDLILKQAFFDQIIMYPSLFSVVNHHIYENDDQYLAVSNFLKQIFTDDFIHEFNQIIISGAFFNDTFLNQQYADKYYSSFKNSKVFSNLDEIIMEKIDGIEVKITNDRENSDMYEFIKDKKIEKYDLFCGIYSEDEINDNEESFYQKTYTEKIDGWSYIKDLLKKSPPLLSNPQKKNYKDIINSALIDKYDPMNSISDFLSYTVIQNNIRKFSAYDANFEQMKTKHNEVKEAISAGHFLESEIKNITNTISNIIIFNCEYFITYMTKNEQMEIKIPFKAHEIVANPIQTITNLISYVKKSFSKTKKITGNLDGYSVLARRFYNNFHFNDFLAFRSDLIKYDQQIQNRLMNKFHIIKGIIVESAKNSDGGDKIFLKTLQYNTTDFDYYSKKIITTFEENSDPISKTNDIYNIIFDFITTFNNNANRGQDEQYNMIEFLLAYANPPHMFSNIIYIAEFCNFEKNCGPISILSNHANYITNVCKLLIDHLDVFNFDVEQIQRKDYNKLEEQSPVQQIDNDNAAPKKTKWYDEMLKGFSKKLRKK